MNNTKIEWCDSTWNPVTGCFHGCEYCYAKRIAERFSTADKCHTFIDGRPIGKVHELEYPARVIGERKITPYPFGFEPTLHRYRLGEPQTWKKPRTVFVCSMADLFGDWGPDDWIEQVFGACEKAPWHRYLFLTKNPKRYAELAMSDKLPLIDNMWYGSTVTEPDDYWWNTFLIYNMFLSIEPIHSDFPADIKFGVDWIIIGAETGNQKGKIIPQKSWIDHICEAADAENIPVFMKDSLIPIVGEKNMRREFPWEVNENEHYV